MSHLSLSGESKQEFTLPGHINKSPVVQILHIVAVRGQIGKKKIDATFKKTGVL